MLFPQFQTVRNECLGISFESCSQIYLFYSSVIITEVKFLYYFIGGTFSYFLFKFDAIHVKFPLIICVKKCYRTVIV